jgi:hypothetical protein
MITVPKRHVDLDYVSLSLTTSKDTELPLYLYSSELIIPCGVKHLVIYLYGKQRINNVCE